MTQAKTRETLLEELAKRVNRTMDRECLKVLKRSGNNRVVLAPIADKLVGKLRSWSDFGTACDGRNPREVVMDVLTTYVIPAHQKYPDQREEKRVDYYIGDLQLTR